MNTVCKECGDLLTVSEQATGLCEAYKWDRSFSATTEWGEDVTINRFNEKLSGTAFMPEEVWSLLFNTGPGIWTCTACGNIRYHDSPEAPLQQGDAGIYENYNRYLEEIFKVLRQPCIHCKSTGCLKFEK